jgi:hypothetical protein
LIYFIVVVVRKSTMADRRSDRHKVPRILESGAEKRKRIKEQAENNLKLLSKTRRMTDFIQVSEASQRLPAVIDPEREPEDTSMINDEGDCDTDTSQSKLQNPVEVDVVDHQTQHREPGTSHDRIYSNSSDAVESSRESNPGDAGNDIGMWPPDVNKEVADYWIKNGTGKLQNCDETLFEEWSAKQTDTTGEKKWHRKCTLSMFGRRNRNGEVVKRSWLCFSPAHGKLYCSACTLMGSSRIQLTHDGFCDWRHASARLAEHETSKDHLEAVVGLARRAKELGIMECDMTRQLADMENYWREVLKRIISVITFICERGLALRGDNETIGSPNNGNYLGMLELIAEYDDFLKQHIQKHGNRGSGHTNYLSLTICEEFIELMGKRVLFEITSRIKESRYYSISLDSTPDEGHIDQLTLVFRYMEKTNPVERFVKFMPNQGHKAQDMFDGLVDFLDEHGIEMSHCRGQSYDNAAAMSGRYNGLQAKVAAENNLAAWIPCAGEQVVSKFNFFLSEAIYSL